MKRFKLLSLFAVALLWLGGQNSNAITLTAVAGDHWGSNESPVQLVDGKTGTKWGNGGDGPHYAIFKTDLPVSPTSYVLRIANDTNTNPGRNWKTWKIYAANFASDEAATKDAEEWALIDAQTDVELPTDQYAECVITISGDDKNFYTYFKIVVEELVTPGQYMQMDEFWFKDYTVDVSAFAEQIQKCKDFDLTGVDEPLTAEYTTKLNQLLSSEDPSVIEKLIGELNTLQAFITEYKDKTFAPLSAVGAGVWGDGFWGNLIDGDYGTKCGGGLPNDGAWLVFRATGGAQPFVYSLVTGGDTKSYPGRNWKTWKIFGANFENVADATRTAEGWVLLDSRENVGQDLFPAENLNPATFSFSEFPDGLDKPYYYFKVELIAAYDGTAYQMTELEFLTKQQVEDTRASLLAEFDDFDVENLQVEPELADVKAQYLAKLEELKTTNDVVAMSKAYNALKELRKQLQASADYVAGDCYHALDGNTAWGDGENWTKLVDGDISTKWGGGMPEGGSYVVFKAYSKSTFGQYMLVTGNDTKNSPDRNWKTWKIYGIGGKVTDDNATRDNSAWKLIDSKENIGQDRLPGDNFVPAYFNISEEWTTAYQYFKIEVEAAYDGGSIQMSEFKFLSDEEYAAIRDEKVAALNEASIALADLEATLNIPEAVKAQLMEQLKATIGGKIEAVGAATADDLLPLYNETMQYITVEVPAMIADYNLVEVDGVYQIGTANQLVNFATFVNSGEMTANAVLTADIDLTGVEWASIGNNDVPYTGTFDGQGKTIIGFAGTTPLATGKYGLFGNIDGATVKNFSIAGTLTVPDGASNGSGVVGWASGGSVISNINSTLVIDAGGNAAHHVGGVVGSAQGGTNIITNCTFAGSLTVADGSYDCFAGIVGYISSDKVTNCANYGTVDYYAANCYAGGIVGYINNANPTVANCLNVGPVTYKGEGSATYGGAIIGRHRKDAANVTNNYWLEGSATTASSDKVLESPSATSVTTEQLASGEVCYELNGDQTTINWFQSLTIENYPTPYGTSVVYLNGHMHCDGALYEGEDFSYGNENLGVKDDHTFTDGLCSYCNTIDETFMAANEESYFEIGTAAQLVWFSAYVNQIENAAKAVLTSDITLTEDWMNPIGNWVNSAAFKGHFDGQGYTIDGLTGTSTQNYFGLFGVISDCLIENFTIKGNISSSYQYAGSVAGYARDNTPTIRNVHSLVNINNSYSGGRQGGILGGSMNGTVVIDRCWYSGTLDGNDAGNNGNYGGIVGYINNNANATLNISNSLFDGQLINEAETPGNCTFGGIIGYIGANPYPTIKNCLSVGTLQSAITAQICGAVKGANTVIENTYYKGELDNGTPSTVEKPATEVNDEQLASGEVAAKLGSAFGQELGVDPYPVLGGKKVYDLAGTYSNNFDFEIESAQGDADCILPSMKYGGSYSAYTYVAQGDFDYGDWNTSNPNYNKIIGTPEEQDGKAWYMPGFNVAAWNYGKDLPNFGDGRPADVYAVRFFTVEGEIPSTLYMPAPHDDAPCEYYINGVQVFAETDGWYEDEVVRFTDEQKALIKANGTCVNVFAFHVHQNWGGRYADGGLYTAGDPVNAFKSSVEALDATIALAEKEGIDAEVIDFAKSKSNYRGGIGSGLAQVRKARRLAFDARTEDFKGTAPADGMIAYIYNVDAKMFLAGGNDWGTHASLNHMGAKCVLHANSSGANRYAIQTNLPNGRRGANDGLGHNGYVDCGYGDDFTTAQGWAWEFKALGDGTYNIINADNNLYLGMTDDDRLQVDTDKAADNPYNAWIFVTPEEFEALAADATEENPVDLGHLVHQATFSQNDFEGDDKGPANLYEDNEEVWKYSAWDRNAGSIWNWKGNSAGGDYMFEMWNTASKGYVYLIQEVEGLPAGNYTVSMNGYYRDGNFESADEGNVRQLAYLFAGSEDNCVPLASIVEGSGNCPGYGRGGASGIVIPDGCYDAAKFFQVGTYVNTIDAVVGADGKLKIGVYRDAEDVKGGDWITTDNWRLYYKGNPVEVTVTDAGYATFVAPGNITTIPEGVEAFAAQVKTDYVHLEPVTAIPAGEAVVLKAAEGTYSMKATAFTAELGTDNDLVAATEEVTADGTQYILAKQDETAGFAKATPDTKIPAGKGYLVITGADVKPFYPFTDDATGIKGVEIANESGLIYNLAGQRVSKAQKGINIINGKKVLK